MPHFENFDQYETTDRSTGQRRVLPIAPHSIQASDYQPRRREGTRPPRRGRRELLPPLKNKDFPLVSAEEMEREYKRARRRSGGADHRPLRNPISDLLNWIKGLFKSKPKPRKALAAAREERRLGRVDSSRQGERGGRSRSRDRSRGGNQSGDCVDNGSGRGIAAGSPEGGSGGESSQRSKRRKRRSGGGERGGAGPRGDESSRSDPNRPSEARDPAGDANRGAPPPSRRDSNAGITGSGASGSNSAGNRSRKRKRNRRPGGSDNPPSAGRHESE